MRTIQAFQEFFAWGNSFSFQFIPVPLALLKVSFHGYTVVEVKTDRSVDVG
jgi:hypothetical protein